MTPFLKSCRRQREAKAGYAIHTHVFSENGFFAPRQVYWPSVNSGRFSTCVRFTPEERGDDATLRRRLSFRLTSGNHLL